MSIRSVGSLQNPGKLRLSLVLPIVLFLVALLTHAIYVSLYAGGLPFWDQWDEVDRFFRPWMMGDWHISQLFLPHNEHRIVFTRLFSLGLFSLNGNHWDNLVVAYAGCALFAMQFTILYALLCGHISTTVRLVFLACVASAVVLPYDCGNTLIGFQSQFYFLAITALGMLAIVTMRPFSSTTLCLLCLLGVASLFTMASGLLASTAVAAAMLLRYWRDRQRPVYTVVAIVAMLVITAVGLAIIPHVAHDEPMHAHGLVDWITGLSITLMWPWPVPRFGISMLAPPVIVPIVFLWLPSLVWLVRFTRSRKADASELFAAGVAVWVGMQALAIVYARGHDMTLVPSRYTDILVIGTLTNGWFALRLLRTKRAASNTRWITTAVAVAFFVVASWGFVKRTPADLVAARERHELALARAINVNRFVHTHDISRFLQQPGLLVSYPRVKWLRGVLDDPVILAMLSPSIVQDPSDAPTVGVLSKLAERMQYGAQSWFGMGSQGSIPEFHRVATSDSIGPASALKARCWLDMVNQQIIGGPATVFAGSPMTLGGWVTDAKANTPQDFSLVLAGPGTFVVNGTTGVARPDVARALHSKDAETSGFYLITKLPDGIDPGRYRVLVKVHAHGHDEACDTQRTIVVLQ